MINLMLVVMGIVLFTALLPVITDSIKNLRGSESLNCVSTKAVCGSSPEPCYNSSLETESTTCLIVNIYTPYIAMAVLIILVMGLMSGRISGGGGGYQSPQQYIPQYQ
jgi:hypothetical protein